MTDLVLTNWTKTMAQKQQSYRFSVPHMHSFLGQLLLKNVWILTYISFSVQVILIKTLNFKTITRKKWIKNFFLLRTVTEKMCKKWTENQLLFYKTRSLSRHLLFFKWQWNVFWDLCDEYYIWLGLMFNIS